MKPPEAVTKKDWNFNDLIPEVGDDTRRDKRPTLLVTDSERSTARLFV
jgi:hypothetical protein